MNTDLNPTAPVRPGEELPLDRLAAWLRKHLPNSEGPLSVEQFPHGHSNLTYLLRLGTRELVLRRPPFGNQVKTAHDMGREYRMLARLSTVFVAAPRPDIYCDDDSVIGSQFYLMERRHGVVLRKTIPPVITFDADMARRLSHALVDNLAAMHLLDYQAAGLSELGKPDGYVQRQVAGWIKRFDQAKISDTPTMDRVAQWLAEHLPPDSGAAVIHNDYKYDNLLLASDNPTRIVAVLDWEMATIGDPLMDLGTTLGYWVEAGDPEPLRRAAFGPTALPGSLTRRELVERYQEQTGRSISNVLFYYCFGLFKIGVIVQQIYARYVRGHTHDPRFAHLDLLVSTTAQQADQGLQADRL